MKKSIKKYVFIIFIITLFLFLKLFLKSRYLGHDTTFHVPNITALSKTISLNNLFGNNIVQLSSNLSGYGTWLFYPKIPHLLAAYLYKITNNIYLSMNIVYFITTFISGVLMFFLGKKIYKNNNIALLSSVIYLTISYRLLNIFVRDAFAENFMFVSIPLIFLGLIYLKEKNIKKFYIYFSLGCLLGIYSHLLLTFYCFFFVLFYILYNHKIYFKKDKFIPLLKCTIFIFLLSLPFIITIIEHKFINTYSLFLNPKFTSRNTVLNNNLYPYQIFIPNTKFDDFKFSINIVISILLFFNFTYYIYKKINKKKVNNESLYILSIVVLVILICSKTIWKYIPKIFILIQFPWRLMTFLAFVVSIYSLYNISNLYKKSKIKKKWNISFVIAIIFLVSVAIYNEYYFSDYSDDINTLSTSIYSMGHGLEYLPFDQVKNYENLYKEYNIRCNKCENEIIEDNFPNMIFKISNIEKVDSVILPRTYYLGYELKDDDGNKIKLVMSEDGYLEANINKNGTYHLQYRKTNLEKICIIISNMTIIIVIVNYINKKKSS